MDTLVNEVRGEILSRCKWFADSGHEWLQVPLKAARFADKIDKASGGDGISTFSYVKGSFAYLEGDCDAALFMKYLDVSDIEASAIHANGVALYTNQAPVRNYRHWGA